MTERDTEEEVLQPIGDPGDAQGDFADEHSEPTLADEPPPEEDPDESVPEGRAGMD